MPPQFSAVRYFFPLLFFFLPFAPAAAQTGYVPPLKGPLLITGTFGELRSNHYHGGLDFRAAVGTPVHAVKEGFVSRIVVSGGGYGQAIYVDHPDGYRSVYGHLESLATELKDTIRALQFAEESFAQNVYFDSLAFPVSIGQKIGGVGNRGHSFGPHLHFEMRKIDGDVPLNPMRFGFSIPDHRAPQIRSLRVYELDAVGRELAATTYQVGRPGKGQKALPDTIIVRTPNVGLAIKAYDRQDGMPNWNGIYSAAVVVDSLRQSGFNHSSIPYDITEYINAQTDYREWNKNTSWYHRLWALSPVQSGVGEAMNDGPWITLQPGIPRSGHVEATDMAGNVTEVKYILKYVPDEKLEKQWPHQYYLPAGEESLIERPGFSFYLPTTALYQDLYLQFAQIPDNSADVYSPTFQIHEPLTPLHGRATLKIAPNRPVADSLRPRLYLGQCNDKGEHSSRGGSWTDDGMLEARIGSFGDYALYLDTIPPRVRINSFPTNLSRYAGFSVLITDDVRGGGLEYRGTIDGKWVLLEYDAKNDKLTHSFADGNTARGNHTFELTVSDARGNTTTWTRNFTR